MADPMLLKHEVPKGRCQTCGADTYSSGVRYCINHHREWMKDALCREYESAMWFVGSAEDPENYNKAKEVCGRCLVREECLEYGLDEEFGIWGGQGPTERKRTKKERKYARQK